MNEIDDELVNNKKGDPENTSVSGFPNLFYEPGNHKNLGPEWDRELKKMRSGNLESTMWNDEVLMRIQEYKPRVLFSDSQFPLYPLGQPNHETEVYARFGLPGRVKKLNDEGVVYLVQGDITGPRYYGKEGNSSTDLHIEKTASLSKELIDSTLF